MRKQKILPLMEWVLKSHFTLNKMERVTNKQKICFFLLERKQKISKGNLVNFFMYSNTIVNLYQT